MPRRLKIKTQEMGDLELYLIYQYGLDWEKEWRPLQGTPFAALLSVTTKENLDHALRGWSWPLTSQLGISPEGALVKVPEKQCYRRGTCPFFEKKKCVPTAKALPFCFEPDVDSDDVRPLASELVRLWREGVYIVVVLEEGVE